MSPERLPKGAYAALEGLQAQASAAAALLSADSSEAKAAGRKALAAAHAQITDHLVWVKKIIKALNNTTGITVQEVDAEWMAQTFSERVAQWPAGGKMHAECPNCQTSMAVDIDAVRKWEMDWRPVECDACFAEFELHAGGQTVLMSAPAKNTTAKGREFLNKVIYFDPNAGESAPNTTAVEILLGGVGRLMFPDGTEQFVDDDSDPALIYSPRLKPEELERFCEQHLDHYERFHQAHKEQLMNAEPVAMAAFW